LPPPPRSTPLLDWALRPEDYQDGPRCSCCRHRLGTRFHLHVEGCPTCRVAEAVYQQRTAARQ